MPAAPTIVALIRNRTLDVDMAATLWAAVDQRRSFVVAAVPRLAGKSTVGNAMLGLLPQEVPVHRLSGDPELMASLKAAELGGYLVVAELSQGPMPGYIWGKPVGQVFDTMAAGYSLATSLHASGLEDTFNVICRGNGVTDGDASRIGLVVYIRRFGATPATFWRRVAESHEVDRVTGGRPQSRLLHRWVERGDGFETVDLPRAFASDLTGRAARLAALAQAEQSAPDDVARLVAEYCQISQG